MDLKTLKRRVEMLDAVSMRLINFESDEWHSAVAKNLEEERKLIEAGFEFIRYSERDDMSIYRKRK